MKKKKKQDSKHVFYILINDEDNTVVMKLSLRNQFTISKNGVKKGFMVTKMKKEQKTPIIEYEIFGQIKKTEYKEGSTSIYGINKIITITCGKIFKVQFHTKNVQIFCDQDYPKWRLRYIRRLCGCKPL